MSPREAITQMQHVLAQGRVTWTSANELKLSIYNSALNYDLLRPLIEFGLEVKLPTQQEQRVFDSGGIGCINAGSAVDMMLPRQWGKFVVAKDIDDLMSFASAHDSVPAAYLLLELWKGHPSASYVTGDAIKDLPSIQQRYHQAVELWNILRISADHLNAEGNLMFFGPKPSEIKPGFDRVNLEHKPLWEPPIRKFICDPDRQEVRKQIFRSCLGDLLRDTTPEYAFRTFLQSTDVFERHLREGMAMYLADNTPEKLANDGRAQAMALSESLEKIIGGLEAKGLTVPAALLLAVKDMHPGTGVVGLNAVIAASLFIFAATMFFIDRSQRALIRQLTTTIDDATGNLKRKGLDESNPVIKERLRTLRERALNAKHWSVVVCIVSFVPLLVVLYMSIYGVPLPAPASNTHSLELQNLQSDKSRIQDFA